MCHLDRRAVSAAKSVLYIAVLMLFLPAMLRSSDALAQTTARDTARADLEARQRALRNLDNLKTKLSRRPSEPRPVVYRQTKEDFEQLQLVNYHLSVTVASVSSALDYEQVRKDAAEIRKRALRLKASLLLPEPDKDEKLPKSKEESAAEELKPAIDGLNALVNSFVWNPIFQQPQVLDVEHSVKARHDLDGIIRLSEQLHKRAEALVKATGKNH